MAAHIVRKVAVAQIVVVQVAGTALGLVHSLCLAHKERPAACRVVGDHIAVGTAGALRVAPLHHLHIAGGGACPAHRVELLAVGALQLLQQPAGGAAEIAPGIVAVGDQLVGV